MQASPLEQFGLGRGDFLFLGWHSSLPILACLACTLTRRTGWLKTKDWRGEGLECSPVPLYHHRFQWSSACLYLKRKGARLSLPFPYLCFFFFPSHRRGLLPEQADVVESCAAKLYSSWGESLLWIKPCPQPWSGLNFTAFVQSDWRGASDYCLYLWRVNAINTTQDLLIITVKH